MANKILNPPDLMMNTLASAAPDTQGLPKNTPPVESIPVDFPKKGLLSGATKAMAATQPWLAVGLGIAQIGISYFAAKKEEKRLAREKAALEAEKERVLQISTALDNFYTSLRSDKEKAWHSVLFGQIMNNFFDGSLGSTEEFLLALQRRVSMGTLSTGRNAKSGIFCLLPYLFNKSGTRQAIGIILKGKAPTGSQGSFLYYFETPDIGVPATCFNIDVPWTTGTTHEKFLPVKFPANFNKNDIGGAYIVPGGLSKAEIIATTEAVFVSMGNMTARTTDANILKLRYDGAKGSAKDGIVATIQTAIDGIYQSYKRDITGAEISAILSSGRNEYIGYQEYQYEYPMINFVPYVEIRDNAVVLNWYDSFDMNYFRNNGIDTSRSELSKEIVQILLYEKGFLTEFNENGKVSDQNYLKALNMFRLANNLDLSVDYLDKVTESVLRGSLRLERNWTPYNWGIDTTVSTDWDISREVVKIKSTALPIQEGEQIPIKINRSSSLGAWADSYHPSTLPAKKIQNSDIAKLTWDVWEDAGKAEEDNYTVKMSVLKGYRIIGYTIIFHNERNSQEYSRGGNVDTVYWKGKLDGGKGDKSGKANIAFEIYIQRIVPLIQAVVYSRPFFPVLVDLGEMQIEYVKVRDFLYSKTEGEQIFIELQASNNLQFENNVSKGWKTEKSQDLIQLNSLFPAPIPISPEMLFFRWVCLLKSPDGITSPLLTAIGINFNKKQYISDKVLTFNENLSAMRSKLLRINTLVGISGIPSDLLTMMKVKQLVLSSEVSALQEEYNWYSIQIDKLLAKSHLEGLTMAEKTQCTKYAEKIEKVIKYEQIDMSPYTTEVEAFLVKAIEGARDVLRSQVKSFEKNNIEYQTVALTNIPQSDYNDWHKSAFAARNLSDSINAGLNNANKLIDADDFIQINIKIEFEKMGEEITLPDIELKRGQLFVQITEKINKIKKEKSDTIAMIITDISAKSATYWTMVQEFFSKKKEDPIVLEFSASPMVVNTGESFILLWKTFNADSVSIGGSVQAKTTGMQTIFPERTNSYRLVATGNGKSVERLITVTVTDAVIVSQDSPAIISFTASQTSIVAGESTTLVWDVKNAITVEINGSTQTTNHMTVSPKGTTIYNLIAVGKQKAVSKTVKVIVSEGVKTTPVTRKVQPQAQQNMAPMLAIGAVLLAVLVPKSRKS